VAVFWRHILHMLLMLGSHFYICGRVHKFPAWPTLKGDRNETTLLFFNIISLYFNTIFTSVNQHFYAYGTFCRNYSGCRYATILIKTYIMYIPINTILIIVLLILVWNTCKSYCVADGYLESKDTCRKYLILMIQGSKWCGCSVYLLPKLRGSLEY